MSTKNLGRTVIEGGRSHGNCYVRRHSHRAVRNSERTFTKAVLRDAEIAEWMCPIRLKPVWKDFHDKLGPAMRWLRSHVGERWVDVHSEILRRFDTRTLAGRHIVFGHLIPSAKIYPFDVDERGILREPKWPRRRSSFLERRRQEEKARDFVSSRRVGARGSAWFWFVPTFAEGMPTGRFRQDRRLTEVEAREWCELLPQVRDAFKPC